MKKSAPAASAKPDAKSASSVLSAVKSPTPTGSEIPAQGNALGLDPKNISSPNGAKESGELPNGWRRVRLGDIAKTTSGGTPRRDRPQYFGGNIPWVKSGELGDSVVYETSETITDEAIESSNAKIFPKGTLCIALYGATVGKLGILGIDAATNQAVCAIFPSDELDTRYLYRFFEGKRRELVEQSKGGAQPNISQGIIRDTQIPFPSVPEQRRIVAEIEKQFTRLEAGVVALRRVQASLKRYRAAVLKAACEGQLVPTEAELTTEDTESTETGSDSPSVPSVSSVVKNTRYESGEQLLQRILAERRKNWTGRGPYKEPAAPDTANLPPLPAGWTWATVEQLVTQPLCNGISIKGSDHPPGVRALRLSAMSHAGFDYSEFRYLPLADADVDDLWIQEGDFFMSRGNGSLHLVGRGTSAQKPPQPTIFPDTMIRLRWDKSIRKAGWVRALWPSRIVRSQIEQKVKTTAGIYKIAQPQVEQITLPLPPLAEQTRIVAEVERRLSVVEELESVVSASLQRATRLRQSILQKAFSGKLKAEVDAPSCVPPSGTVVSPL